MSDEANQHQNQRNQTRSSDDNQQPHPLFIGHIDSSNLSTIKHWAHSKWRRQSSEQYWCLISRVLVVFLCQLLDGWVERSNEYWFTNKYIQLQHETLLGKVCHTDLRFLLLIKKWISVNWGRMCVSINVREHVSLSQLFTQLLIQGLV
jgi:hypothetical protein